MFPSHQFEIRQATTNGNLGQSAVPSSNDSGVMAADNNNTSNSDITSTSQSPGEILAQTWSTNSNNSNTSPEEEQSPGDKESQSRNNSTSTSSTNNNNSLSAKKQEQVRSAAKGKRRRKALSCNFCRQRKLKCDRQQPCSTCLRRDAGSSCRYGQDDDGSNASGGSMTNTNGNSRDQNGTTDIPQPKVGSEQAQRIARGIMNRNNETGLDSSDMKKRLDQMETLVMTMLANGGNKQLDPNGGVLAKGLDPERETSLVSFSGSSHEDEIDRLGESLGLIKLDKKGKSIYHGDTHWCTLFSDVADVQEFFKKLRDTYESINPDAPVLETCVTDAGKQLSSTIAPFQGVQSAPVSGDDVLSSIPSRELCDVLVNRYFLTFQAIFPVVHRPSFDEWYASFWEDQENSQLVWVALLLGILSLGLLSYLPPGVPAPYRGKMTETVNKWLGVMETVGHIGRITIKPSLVHVRVMILWMFAQGGTIQSKDWLEQTWIPMGMISRVVQSMGMHRDSKWFAMSVFETEQRRRMFALIKYLDFFFGVAQGLPLALRLQENDVEGPANCNDIEVMPMSDRPPHSMGLHLRTDASFTICRNKMTELACRIMELNTRVDKKRIDNISYDHVLHLHDQIQQTWNSYPPYFKVRCDKMSAGEPDDLIIQRFMLEIEYLRTLVMLHRPFMSAGAKKAKYRKSRDVSIEAALSILSRHCWLFETPEAAAIRAKYWWSTCVITFQHFVHSSIFVSVYLMNYYDSIVLEERNQQLNILEKSLPVMSFAHFSPMHDSSQSLLLHVLVGQVKEVTKMTPLQRASRLKRKDPTVPAKGMTMELVHHVEDPSFSQLHSPNSMSDDVSPRNGYGSISGNSTGAGNDGGTNGDGEDSNKSYGFTPEGEVTGDFANDGFVPTGPGAAAIAGASPMGGTNPLLGNQDLNPFSPGTEQMFDSALFKSVSGAVGSEEWDSLMANLGQSDVDFNMFNNSNNQ